MDLMDQNGPFPINAKKVSKGDSLHGRAGKPPPRSIRSTFQSDARILGVDIGTAGGLALLSAAGELLDVAPMPVLADGPKGRPAVNAPLLAALLWRWAPASAFVEYVGARPGEAASSAFAFGRSRGVVEGVLGAQEVPTRLLTPSTWKRAIGIPPGRDGAKDFARAEAVRRWPGQAQRFAAKGSDGLAEAALIAVAGMAREVGR